MRIGCVVEQVLEVMPCSEHNVSHNGQMSTALSQRSRVRVKEACGCAHIIINQAHIMQLLLRAVICEM